MQVGWRTRRSTCQYSLRQRIRIVLSRCRLLLLVRRQHGACLLVPVLQTPEQALAQMQLITGLS